MVEPDRPRRGFTLVELLIVVVVLGILAAIVMPKFSDAAETSREAAMRGILRTVRSQVELYRVQHEFRYPQLDQMWSVMTELTDAEGNILPAGRYGPYLGQPPRHPYNSATTVVAVGAGTASDGWEYDEATGAFFAVGFDELTGIYTAP